MKNKNLARKVKQLRKKRGFSQEELTEHSGLSLRTIQRIEKGETEPTGDTLKKISNALNINPEELFDWTIIEDRGFLKAMNLSTLAFILFPPLGILIPLIMWISKKDKLKDINKIAKNIINFEITWTIVLFAGVVLNFIILYKKMNSSDLLNVGYVSSSQSFTLTFIIVMYLINTSFIIINTYKIYKNKNLFYYPKVNFI